MSSISDSQESKVSIEFEKVVGRRHQTDLLYELLKKRRYSISHRKLPSYKEHQSFVSGAPYKVWYLVFRDNACLGSFYLHEDNSIGINLNSDSLEVICQCLKFLTENYRPREEIESKVPPYFYVNVPHDNENLKKIIEKMGCKPIQTSFRLNR